MTPWLPMFGMLMGFASIIVTAWVIYVIVDGFRRRQQVRSAAEFQARLLERIGSAREFGDFLNSEGGAQFLHSISPPENGVEMRILRALQSGVVSLFIGVAVAIYTAQSLSERDPGLQDTLNLVAAVLTAIGLALLLSAAVSYRLSRRMGLVDTNRRRDTRDSTPSI